MTDTREFPTAVIASVCTGVLLCEFSKMHEAAEYIMGHPIWTHHFADRAFQAQMQAAILEQCPGMPTEIEGCTKDNYLDKLAAIEAEVGPMQRVRRGSGLTAMHPMDGIPDHLKVVTIETPK